MATGSARIVLFAAAVCVVCATVVTSTAVLLADRKERNAALDVQRNVLEAAGIHGHKDPEQVASDFEKIDATVVELASGRPFAHVDAASIQAPGSRLDRTNSREAPQNDAQIQRIPNRMVIYEVRDDQGKLDMVILPIEGKGLWSTLRGFLSLESDLETIYGITFYSHAETAGLGGEIDNPKWKARWKGRRAFGPEGEVRIEVAKGSVGSPQQDPYRVDGITGATITSRGVSDLVRFWLGEHGFGPYLHHLAEEMH